MQFQLSQMRQRTKFAIALGLATALGHANPANAISIGGVGNTLNSANGEINQVQTITGQIGDPGIQSNLNQATQYLNAGDSYLGQVEQYWNDLTGFYKDTIGVNLSGILGDVQQITGALGIPDPFAARSILMQKATTPAEVMVDHYGANDADRQIVQGVISTTIGKDGQTYVNKQKNNIETNVQTASDSANNAQLQLTTQNVLKLMASGQAAQTALNGQISAQLVNVQTQEASSNLMLDDISTTLDRTAAQKQIEEQESLGAEIAASQNVWIPGWQPSNNN